MTATRPFDPMDHLITAEDHAALLNAAFAIGERALIVHALREIVRAHGTSDLTAQMRIRRSRLDKSLSDVGNPTLDIIRKVVGAMRLRLSVEITPTVALARS